MTDTSKQQPAARTKGDPPNRIQKAVAVQAGAWTACAFWYPFWRLSATQEAHACDRVRPSIRHALGLLTTKHGPSVPRAVYSGFGMTMALQPFLYPVVSTVGDEAVRRGHSRLGAEVAVGALWSPLVCAPWKTWVLSKSRSNLTPMDARAPPAKALSMRQWYRGLHAWSARNAVLAPCIWNGQLHTRRLFTPEFQRRHPRVVDAACLLLPSLLATVVSHPADLLTGLLNGDPQRQRFAGTRDALQQLVRTHGLRGLLVASPCRFVALSIEVALFPKMTKWWMGNLEP